MTTVTISAGYDAALRWTHAAGLDTGTESLTIRTSAGVAVIGPTAVGVASLGAGVYTYVWATTSATADGAYTAVLSGEILGVAASSTVTVVVTNGYGYITIAELKEELGIDSTAQDVRLSRAIVASSRAIEAACGGRRFYADSTAVAREYTIGGRVSESRSLPGQMLIVDDIATSDITAEVGSTGSWSTISASSIITSPDNALLRGRPISALIIDSGSWDGHRRAKITTRWGWPAIPPEVEQACQLQAMRLARRRLTPEGVMSGGEFGGPIRIPRLDPDVHALISHLVLPAVG